MGLESQSDVFSFSDGLINTLRIKDTIGHNMFLL